jgi:hypothetical protein
MEDWAARPTRIATYVLAACVGAVMWLLLTAATAAAEEEPVPDGLGSVALEQVVTEVAEAVEPHEREAGRVVQQVAEVAGASRAVGHVTEQVDRTTDVVADTVTTVAGTVGAAVTDPVLRPVLGRPDKEGGAEPDPAPEEPRTARPGKPGATEARTGAPRAWGPHEARAAAPAGTPRHLERASADARVLDDRWVGTTADTRPAEPAAAAAASTGAGSVPDDGQPVSGDPAAATGSSDTGGAAVAVIDGQSQALVRGARNHPVRHDNAPPGPAVGPAFSPD